MARRMGRPSEAIAEDGQDEEGTPLATMTMTRRRKRKRIQMQGGHDWMRRRRSRRQR
jgi:hypothetical protein